MKPPFAHGLVYSSLVAALAAALVCSCGDDDCANPTGYTALRDTPEHLISSFCAVLEKRSLDQYFWCLDDNYRFTFDQRDWSAAGVDSVAPYWEKCRDMTSTTYMFRHGVIESIACDLVVVGEITASDTLATCACDLDLKVIIGEGEYTVTYRADKSVLNLVMSRDRSDPGLWVIRGITEDIVYSLLGADPGGQAAVEAASFGALKAMYQ